MNQKPLDALRDRWSGTLYWEEDGFRGLPGRYYMLMRSSGWMGDSVTFLYDFEDWREAAAFARFCLIPGALANSDDGPGSADPGELASEFFPAGSRRVVLLNEIFGACEKALTEQSADTAQAIDQVVSAFNLVFDNGFEGEEGQLPRGYRIEAHGPLIAILVASDLQDERNASLDQEACFEHEELAALIEARSVDDASPQHLALAAAYLERYPLCL